MITFQEAMSLNPEKEYYVPTNNANRYLESYNLYRDGVFIANTGLSTSYADSNVEFDVEYCYSVTAVYTEGESSQSNVDCATALDPGSVVELERLAGEPLDILANGTKIAKGEVVMVGEKFGIRFTEVADPEEMVQNL